MDLDLSEFIEQFSIPGPFIIDDTVHEDGFGDEVVLLEKLGFVLAFDIAQFVPERFKFRIEFQVLLSIILQFLPFIGETDLIIVTMKD